MGCTQSTPARNVASKPVLSATPKASAPAAAAASSTIQSSNNNNNTTNKNNGGTDTTASSRARLPSSSNDASDLDDRSTASNRSSGSNGSRLTGGTTKKNPKAMVHSTSAIGLDEMIEDRREVGDLRQNVVHIEVPFGKPIEEVYDGVHNGPVLGSGISGLVRLVTHKATCLKYAVKVLDLGLVDTAVGLRQLREEIFIMCQLDHPNIVRLEEVYESHSEIYLVQELCLGGELFDRLDEQPDYHYTEAECARLVKQMLSAVRYLHSKGIIHRDLKLENFLFSSTSRDSELKMIDFGLSKHFRYGEIQHEAVGTPYTVAPEVIHGSYDERCDIWAIGVITYLLLSGEPPFGGCGGPEPLMQVRASILAGKFAFEPVDIWAHVSSSARKFISTLLVTDPQKRPTASEAQKLPWLTEWANRSRKDEDNTLNPNVVKSLVNFKEFSDMRKLLCEVLSFTLLPDQIKELRNEFEKMDTDGSGEISLSALKQVLMTNAGAGSLGALTEEEVEDIFNAMRVRKTETRIHWHEFIAAGLSQCQVNDRNLRLAFDRLDSDHKGYIILDDIMDLMGSDSLQNEDAMRQMWGDSIKTVSNCTTARITYGDFLLLMKGQTREGVTLTPDIDLNLSIVGVATPTSLKPAASGRTILLPSVEEESGFSPESSLAPELRHSVSLDAPATPPVAIPCVDVLDTSNISSFHGGSPAQDTQSAPNTPAGHRPILDVSEIESPASNDGDIHSAGPGVPGNVASLTPPSSPQRGMYDYCTPMGGSRYLIPMPGKSDNIIVPGLPNVSPDVARPQPLAYQGRQRSKSLGGEQPEEPPEADLHAVAEAVREMIVPEHAHHGEPEMPSLLHQGNLAVNRQLYRAHRQMRLAVLEASKRFEEQQTSHARDVLIAQREEAEGESPAGMIQKAGLVMRHGHREAVTSEAIRILMQQNRIQQQALVEKANRRGGRGRRSRKKTASDMSGMLTSSGKGEMGPVSRHGQLLGIVPTVTEGVSEPFELPLAQEAGAVGLAGGLVIEPTGPDVTAADEVGTLREATVPGHFLRTPDPFSKEGKYGAVYK